MGKALLLKTCDRYGREFGGYVWPDVGQVAEAENWSPEPRYGRGLEGLLWGEGDGDFLNWRPDAVWIVAEVNTEEVVDLGNRVKVPRAFVVYRGNREGATRYIYEHDGAGRAIAGLTLEVGDGETAVVGDYGVAKAGNRGTAIAWHHARAEAGDYGFASVSKYSTAVVGAYGNAIAGAEGVAIAGDSGRAEAGEDGRAVVGAYGHAIVGPYGLAIAGEHSTAKAGYCGTARITPSGFASAGEEGKIEVECKDGLRTFFVGAREVEPDTLYRFDELRGCLVKTE